MPADEDFGGKAQAMADAQLIAAAPLLWNALRKIAMPGTDGVTVIAQLALKQAGLP